MATVRPQPAQSAPATGTEARRRLTPACREEDVLPFRRAERLERCLLYWAPVSGFPVPLGQRHWFLALWDRLSELLAQRFGLRAEVFLQLRTTQNALSAPFNRLAPEFLPVLGLGRRPGGEIRCTPTFDELDRLRRSGNRFVLEDHIADYCYWFLDKSGSRQRQAFFGHGGLTMIFLPPDPAPPPELPELAALTARPDLPGIDMRRLHRAVHATRDSFLPRSLDLFGRGLEDHPDLPPVPFVLPLLRSEDFFGRPAEESSRWFQCFDVYVTESPADRGMLLASRLDLENHLVELLHGMRREGLRYPER
jgi:hypothetical protein